MFRISLRGLLLLTAVLAFACGALAWSSRGWLGATLIFVALAFIAAAIVAILDRGPRQAFAIGYVVSFVLLLIAHVVVWPKLVTKSQAPSPLFQFSMWAFEQTHAGIEIWMNEGGEPHTAIYPPRRAAATTGIDPIVERATTFTFIFPPLIIAATSALAGRLAAFVYLRRRRESASASRSLSSDGIS